MKIEMPLLPCVPKRVGGDVARDFRRGELSRDISKTLIEFRYIRKAGFIDVFDICPLSFRRIFRHASILGFVRSPLITQLNQLLYSKWVEIETLESLIILVKELARET